MLLLIVDVIKKYFYNNVLFSMLFIAIFALIICTFFYGRPQIFSYFFIFFELKILYSFLEDGKSRFIFIIPLLAVLWSNLHGGSSNMAYILCIIFLIVGCLNFNFGRIETKRLNKKMLKQLTIVTVLTMIAILVNPIGMKVFIYPYQNLSDKISMNVISEWQAPDAKNIGQLVAYYLPIGLFSIGMIASKKNVKLIDIAIMAAFLFLFLRSVRFIILWYIAASFYAFKYIPEIKVKEMKKNFEKICVYALIALLISINVMSVFNFADTYKNNEFISVVMNENAINAIKKYSPQRIYNDYNLGEALIYNDLPVFFDARADLFAQEHIMEDGISLAMMQKITNYDDNDYFNADELILKYNFDYILTLKTRPLYAYLMSHMEKYELMFSDNNIGYFKVKS